MTLLKASLVKSLELTEDISPLSKSDMTQDPVSETIKDQKLLLSSWFLTGAFESVFEKTS